MSNLRKTAAAALTYRNLTKQQIHERFRIILVSHVEFARRVTVILSATKNLLFMAVKISTVHNADKKQILRCTQNDKGKIVPNKSSMTDHYL